MSAVRALLLPLALLALQGPASPSLSSSPCHGACVEVDSDTEAVVNEQFKLGCISCKIRGDVPATATVNWFFNANDDTDEFIHICSYEYDMGKKEKNFIMNDPFDGRLEWRGSNLTDDLQDGSISIMNVTYNDTGTYRCELTRVLTFKNYKYQNSTTREFKLTVVPQHPNIDRKRPTGTRGMASVLSEVMMYVTIIGLQFWLVVEMIYCYRKIAAAGEEALRESASDYLAIASESKDNCTDVQEAE